MTGRRLVAVVAALAVAVAAVVAYVVAGGDEYEITARFTRTPGLYAENNVDILGVPTGHITAIEPHPGFVEVTIALPADVRLPAGVRAVVMAPNPVSDRFVELTPAYTGGATLAHGATIPLGRTLVPLELDDIYRSVDTFAQALGPAGANRSGALSDVLHAFAKLANGRGADLHEAIAKISAALPALTRNPDDVSKLVNGLDRLTATLAARHDRITSLYDDLASVTTTFADEGELIATAVANLRRGLASVARFLRANRTHLSAGIKQLTTTVAAIMSEQRALVRTFDTAPLGFQNFDRAITLNGPCPTGSGQPATCPGVYARAILGPGTSDFVKTYCGQPFTSVLAILAYNSPVHLAAVRRGDALDTACAAQAGLVQNRTAPPGAPPLPDLELSTYLNR